ncbi:NAD(P)-binding protein [Cucurbitaria berberidis CBS 394.84]|uniref:NAD(P)-binding protein n=1 Tax=Cucurbitaria berberidis CBS 394.84 TaxID=1168544 RepID=A0A9P4GCH4_9PLEO|nr:NAD(P)-binding protein [Cucurbitaria berberidis CBS 394.84]KAF1842709.1 NAD(P)-binding protein [Cucurbitaria berberidis CBS 394.84]
MAGRFLYSQLFVTPPKPTVSHAGKTVIVTGANVGLGKEAARQFTQLGASTVILAVRSLEKGNAAKNDIEASTGRNGVVKVWQLDMASYQSVLDFAGKAEKELDRLDVALLNAGVMRGQWEVFEQDESTITVNVVSTFLLAFALAPKLVETSKKFNTRPNLTIVSSETHEFVGFAERHAPEGKIFERLNEKMVDGKAVALSTRYMVSKLLEVLIVRAWCERKSATEIPVTINFVNPGLCHSEFGREGGWSVIIMKFFLARTTEVGSRVLVAAASLGPESHGQYVTNGRVEDPGTWVLSQEGHQVQQRVWNELVGKLEGIKTGITQTL